MIRIQDTETDATLDLSIPWMLEEAFRVQIGRHFNAGENSRLTAEMSGWLTVAIYQLLDRDLLPPTEKQRSLAQHMSRVLGVEAPAEAQLFRGSMADFIRLNLSAFHERCPPKGAT